MRKGEWNPDQLKLELQSYPNRAVTKEEQYARSELEEWEYQAEVLAIEWFESMFRTELKHRHLHSKEQFLRHIKNHPSKKKPGN